MTEEQTPPPEPPDGLAEGGLKLWHSVADEFHLAEAEQAMLVEACRTRDDLDRLAAVLAKEGPMAGEKVHPALVESRQLRLALARIVASLRLPDDDDTRPQRRGAVRYPYRPGAAS